MALGGHYRLGGPRMSRKLSRLRRPVNWSNAWRRRNASSKVLCASVVIERVVPMAADPRSAGSRNPARWSWHRILHVAQNPLEPRGLPNIVSAYPRGLPLDVNSRWWRGRFCSRRGRWRPCLVRFDGPTQIGTCFVSSPISLQKLMVHLFHNGFALAGYTAVREWFVRRVKIANSTDPAAAATIKPPGLPAASRWCRPRNHLRPLSWGLPSGRCVEGNVVACESFGTFGNAQARDLVGHLRGGEIGKSLRI